MNMKPEIFEKWVAEARRLPEPLQLPMPHHVLMGEAVDVAIFYDTHWKTRTEPGGQASVPGLELAARDGLLTPSLGQEVLELRDATQAAQTQYRFTVAEPNGSGMDRAEFVLGEMRAGLAFLLDDDVEDADDVRLERLQAAHGYPRSQDAMATALDEYAALADQHRDGLQGLGGFDAAVIEEAIQLAIGLRERSALRVAGDVRSAQREALDLRNRLASLLYERMQRIRSAARFVYRGDPERAKRVTSAYERQKRAKYRAAASEAAAPPEAPAAGE